MTEQGIDHEVELRKRLLARVVQHMTEDVIRIAASAISDLLLDAHDELAHDLLAPLFERSEYWPEQMAKQVLNLDEDYEYSCDELLAEFERREMGTMQDEDGADDAWIKEGF